MFFFTKERCFLFLISEVSRGGGFVEILGLVGGYGFEVR